MELLSTETKTAEIKTPIRSRLETSTFSVATSSALKLRHPRTQQAPAWTSRGSSSPLATCRCSQRAADTCNPQTSVSECQSHHLHNMLSRKACYSASTPGVEIT